MDFNPLNVTGCVSPDMPSFVIKDLGLRCGIKSLKLSGLDDVRITASLGKEINAECSSHEVTKDDQANWAEIARLVNPEVEWSKGDLFTEFKRLMPLLTLRGWKLPTEETKKAVIAVIGSQPSIRNPTTTKTNDIPPYLAYGFARRCGYMPSMTDGPDRLLNVLLHVVNGSSPSLADVPLDVANGCLFRLPIGYNCWYHPAPWKVDSEDSAHAVTLREAASEFGLNLFYCADPAKELETFRRGEAVLSSSDTWFGTWYRRNPDYFNLGRRYDPNVPADLYDREVITQRYQVDTLSHVNSLSCRLEMGPVPGGGPIDGMDMAVIRNRTAENIRSSDLIESLSLDDPSYLDYPILTIVAFSREYIGFFDEKIVRRIHLLFDREERLRYARQAYLSCRKNSSLQGSIRRALMDASSMSRKDLVEALGSVGDYILREPGDATELTDDEQVMISILANSL